jgi:hypothetical protein
MITYGLGAQVAGSQSPDRRCRRRGAPARHVGRGDHAAGHRGAGGAGAQLDGLDSLLSIAQMPRGVPVATVAINGATNAGLFAARILSSR